MVNVISTFSGCGGSCLGYIRAGLDVRLAMDFEKAAVETYRLNFKTPIIRENIREISGKKLLDTAGLETLEDGILDGSPPCGSFSMAGIREEGWGKSYKHGSESFVQRSDDLFFEYIRLIHELRPMAFIAENVRGLILGAAKGYFNEILEAMKKEGYVVRALDLNAKNFEVPQSRPRIVFIGIRQDRFKGWPLLFTKKPITVAEALEGVQNSPEDIGEAARVMKTKVMSRYVRLIKPGESASKYHYKGSFFGMTRLHPNKPSPTIITTGGTMLIHPYEDRYLTIPELKRLSTFPDGFRFKTIGDARIRIGNSVPPNLMKNVAKYAMEVLQYIPGMA